MRNFRFVFLCNGEERQKIRSLAEHFRRSQGDAMRFLVDNAYHSLVHNQENPTEQLCRSLGSRNRGNN